MLNLQILRIRQVLNVEELLDLLDTVLGQIDILLLLIDNKISGLLNILAHNGIHLAEFPAGFPSFQLARQDIARFIELRRLPALAGYDQRRPRLVDQYRVHLIDDGILKPPLHQLFLVDHHVIPQVIEAQLVVRHISNITVICRTSLVVVHTVEHDADRKS